MYPLRKLDHLKFNQHSTTLLPPSSPQTMMNNTLAAISHYSTPGQSQQTTTPSQKGSMQDTPAQKRKQGDEPLTESSQASSKQTAEKGPHTPSDPAGAPTPAAHPATPVPPNQAPHVMNHLQSYNVPQFNQERLASPLPSPTSEAVK